jgi:hypothetical protein
MIINELFSIHGAFFIIWVHYMLYHEKGIIIDTDVFHHSNENMNLFNSSRASWNVHCYS